MKSSIPDRAFTLVEFLLSAAILSLLLVVVTMMVDATSRVATRSGNRMDAENEARLVFDRMNLDFNGILQREDVDFVLRKNGTGLPGVNDELYFYSEVPGSSVSPAQQSEVSLAGYRIGNRSKLERLARELVWSDPATSNPDQLTFLPRRILDNTNWAANLQAGSSQCFQLLGDQTFRLEFSFLLKPPPGTTNPPALATSAARLTDIAAIIVALGVLDQRSGVIVSNYDRLIESLPDAQANAEILSSWTTVIEKPDFATRAALPPTAAAAVRVYQRIFPLDRQ